MVNYNFLCIHQYTIHILQQRFYINILINCYKNIKRFKVVK